MFKRFAGLFAVTFATHACANYAVVVLNSAAALLVGHVQCLHDQVGVRACRGHPACGSSRALRVTLSHTAPRTSVVMLPSRLLASRPEG